MLPDKRPSYPALLEPATLHPLYWAATVLLEIPERRLRSIGPFSKADVRAFRDQGELNSRKLLRLADLVDRLADKVAAQSSPKISDVRKPKPPHRYWYRTPETEEFRAAAFAAIRWTVERARVEAANIGPKPRETELSMQLLAAVGSGALRSRVMQQLRGRHRYSTIQHCRRRLNIREELKREQTWWFPPRDMPSFLPPAPLSAPIIRKGKAGAIQMSLERLLIRHPLGLPYAEVMQRIREKHGCNKTAVHRAARDLRILKERSGFGASKRVVWIYQAAIDAVHRKPEQQQ